MILFTTLSQFYIMQMIDKLWGIFCENIVKMLRLVICRQILDNMWAIYWCLPTKCPLLEGDDHLHGDLRKNRFPPKRVDNSQLSLKRGLQSWFFNSQLLNRYNSTNSTTVSLGSLWKQHWRPRLGRRLLLQTLDLRRAHLAQLPTGAHDLTAWHLPPLARVTDEVWHLQQNATLNKFEFLFSRDESRN